MNKRMPFIVGGAILVAVFGILVYLFASSGKTGRTEASKYVATATSRQVAPDFVVRDIFNTTNVSLKMYSNQVILLNFWATWCPPCKLEIPELVDLFKKYKGKFIVIGVSVDREGPEIVKQFYKEHKMNFPVVMASQGMIEAYGGITAIPTSFVIDRTGKVAETVVGYRTEEQYEELIKANF